MRRRNILSVAAFSAALLSVASPHAILAQGGVNMGEWGLRISATASPTPEYPKQSLPKKVEGVVVAAVLFGVDGRLETIDILQSPDEHTATAVRDAVGRWTVPGVQVRGREEKSPVRGKLTFYRRAPCLCLRRCASASAEATWQNLHTFVEQDDGRMRDMGPEATVEDLYRAPGKAELVNGELVVMTPGAGRTGTRPRAVVTSLCAHAATGRERELR
jgi:hypothetical protein